MNQIIISGGYRTQNGYIDNVAYQFYEALFYYDNDNTKQIYREYDVVIDDAYGGNVQFDGRRIDPTGSYLWIDTTGKEITRKDVPQPINGNSANPADLKAEYDMLIARQNDIIVDLEGVAEAITKLNNNLGKQLSSKIASMAAGTVGVPIAIPTQFGYAAFGILGLIPTVWEGSKMKKYKNRVNELVTEFNSNYKRLTELVALGYGPKSNLSGDVGLPNNSAKKTITTPQIIVLVLIVLIIMFLIWRYARN